MIFINGCPCGVLRMKTKKHKIFDPLNRCDLKFNHIFFYPVTHILQKHAATWEVQWNLAIRFKIMTWISWFNLTWTIIWNKKKTESHSINVLKWIGNMNWLNGYFIFTIIVESMNEAIYSIANANIRICWVSFYLGKNEIFLLN